MIPITQDVTSWMDMITEFLQKFGWLADAFIVDFFVKDHFSKLLPSWQSYLTELNPTELANFINVEQEFATGTKIPPLSLLAFRSTVKLLSISRKCDVKKKPVIDPNLANIFRLHVKPKKLYEIEQLSTLIQEFADGGEIIDIGGGIGHVARYIAYGLGMEVSCLDREGQFGVKGSTLDEKLSKLLAKRSLTNLKPPKHIKINLDIEKDNFQDLEKFSLLSLHSCGDLGPLVLREFVKNENCSLVISIGCCYMQMKKGFPMSSYCKTNLSYEARELSCHHIEEYCSRLDSNLGKLKIHCYRAALEVILVEKYGISRAGLRGVKKFEELGFTKYAKSALGSYDFDFGDLDETLDSFDGRISEFLAQWYKVVTFFSLRLMVGMVVESLVVLDRAWYLKETGSVASVNLFRVFDGKQSPRCLAIVANKNKENKIY